MQWQLFQLQCFSGHQVAQAYLLIYFLRHLRYLFCLKVAYRPKWVNEIQYKIQKIKKLVISRYNVYFIFVCFKSMSYSGRTLPYVFCFVFVFLGGKLEVHYSFQTEGLS